MTTYDMPGGLSEEMAALIARMLAEDGPPVDTTLLPAAEGREMARRGNIRWNRELPPMAVREAVVPADPGLGSTACRSLVFTPERAHGTILYIHGGGFAFCSPETHERCCRVLAREAGMAVVSPDYRLAPEHPFPAGLLDAVAVLRALAADPSRFGLAGGPIVVAGDSAGANLALAAMLHEEAAGRPLPAGALLYYGAFDFDDATPSYLRFAEGPGLTRGKMQRYLDWYVPDAACRADPLAAPLKAGDAALAALPPLFLLAAAVDPLLSDTHALAARLRALGRSEAPIVVPGVIHGFLQMSVDLEAARQALRFGGEAARRMADAALNAVQAASAP